MARTLRYWPGLGRRLSRPGLGWVLSLLIGVACTAPAWADPPPPNTSKDAKAAKSDQPPAKDAKALRELIEQKIAQAQKTAATQPAGEAPTRQVPQRTVRRALPAPPGRDVPVSMSVGEPVPVEQAPKGPGSIQPTAQRAGKRAGGCGGKGGEDIDLTPPPPDQPQPVWSCENETVELNNIWSGQQAEFVFKIKNEGEGPLNIRLKGG